MAPRVPRATYRLQFGPRLGFRQAAALVPYLDALGISDLYASPLMVARPGSEHGYDVTDPYHLNPQLGSEADFRHLAASLRARGMGLLLDIVPNHVAASAANQWWMDVLENGPASPCAPYFDIDWQAKGGVARPGTLLLPVLGDPLAEVLARGELTVALGADGFSFRYYEHRFPLSLRSYAALLTLRRPGAGKGERGFGPRRELRRLVGELAELRRREKGVGEAARLRRRRALKRRLWRLYREPPVRALLDETLRLLDARADAAAPERLEALLDLQYYRLAFWRTGLTEVNYRRFFDQSHLAAVRVEEPAVFERRHGRVAELVRKGLVTGLRVDHVDGLYDPQRYLERLRARAAVPVVVEKILTGGEALRAEWPVAGTTGYDFAAAASALFLEPGGARRLRRAYQAFTGRRESFAETRLQAKRQVLHDLFAADFRLLARELARLARADRGVRGLPEAALFAALAEASVGLPIYRTYVRGTPVTPPDREAIEAALAQARRALRGPPGATRALRFLRRVLLLEGRARPAQMRARLAFVLRWQQRTGPLMAKGVEDTAFYVDNALLSLNEVGGDPDAAVRRAASATAWHFWCRGRRRRWPDALSATSTHDTKRGEDARLRLHVLAEAPREWAAAVRRWSEWNAPLRLAVDGAAVPDANEEWMIYQALLGAWPLDARAEGALGARFEAYLRKAAREAKVHTSWHDPDEAHETALLAFVEAALRRDADNGFPADFRAFARRVSFAGAMHALGQVVLKCAAPGVPDFYQGTELWDLSLVDPDNRRPVDFAARRRMLAALGKAEGRGRRALVERLLARWPDGRLKLYVTWKALEARRADPELFARGEYVPLEVAGGVAGHACAFARRLHGRWAVAVVPRRLLALGLGPGRGLAPSRWRHATVRLPAAAPRRWRDALTGESLRVSAKRGPAVALRRAWRRLPVSLLVAS
jgi:(1->4)-alpha-D-glucan 1-alpha-D-glucosylmutase